MPARVTGLLLVWLTRLRRGPLTPRTVGFAFYADPAVVYGVGHMTAVTHEMLRRFGYRPRTAAWLTVFDF
jgi:hypothetical protein